MIFVLCIALVLIGVGIVLGLVAIGCVAALTGLGIVSSATLIGLQKRRLAAGLRALHYQVLTAVAWPAGIALLWLGVRLFDLTMEAGDLFLFGSLGGIAGGLLLAYALDRLAGFAWRRFQDAGFKKLPKGNS